MCITLRVKVTWISPEDTEFSLWDTATPRVLAAVKEQLDRIPLSAKVFFNKVLAQLCQELARITPGELTYTFLCNSGAEAVEGAIKIARLSTGKSKIVAARNSFHGKTLGALSASGRDIFKEGFHPLLPRVDHVTFGDLPALEQAIDEDTAAVLLEPIQGEGGIMVPPGDYLPGVRKICDEKDVLLIADEVQTGLGRTGKMFAVEHWGCGSGHDVPGKSSGRRRDAYRCFYGNSPVCGRLSVRTPPSTHPLSGGERWLAVPLWKQSTCWRRKN